ncbi:MAG: hypothetical protein M3O46_04935, partial [Myxococcota bacterium]|nr:hypothetical protein [Myxococcota bacterium]
MERADRAILGITLLLTAGPPLIDVAHGGVAAACRYSAADAFYYHTVARNIATHGYASFDGVFPTNGFHPLWQVSLGILYKACSWVRFSDGEYVVASIVLSIALVTLSVGLFCLAFLEAKRHLSTWIMLLPLRMYGLIMAPAWYQAIDVKGGGAHWIEGPEPLYGTMWSLMNGMESPLALATFGWIAWRFSRAGPRRAELDAACLALMTLARLDLVFVALPLLVSCAVSALMRRQRRQAFGAIAVYGATIGGYLVINRWYAGVFVPISGAAKSSFPHLAQPNLDALKVTTTRFVDDWGAFVLTWRVAQMFVPAIGALVVLPLLLPGITDWLGCGCSWSDRIDWTAFSRCRASAWLPSSPTIFA